MIVERSFIVAPPPGGHKASRFKHRGLMVHEFIWGDGPFKLSWYRDMIDTSRIDGEMNVGFHADYNNQTQEASARTAVAKGFTDYWLPQTDKGIT